MFPKMTRFPLPRAVCRVFFPIATLIPQTSIFHPSSTVSDLWNGEHRNSPTLARISLCLESALPLQVSMASHSHVSLPFMSSDLSDVVVTNDDATIGKNSSVQMGYYVDPYVPILAKASFSASSPTTPHLGHFETSPVPTSSSATSTGWEVVDSPGASRSAHHIQPPLINRGYYARVAAIRASLTKFLSAHHGSQIVSFGAGFDSTYFILKDEGYNIERYVEIDVGDTVLKKASAIRSKRNLFGKHLPNLSFKSSGEIVSDHYFLCACDLRDLSSLENVVSACGLEKDRPTLFLSECVLIYMTVEESSALIAWASQGFKTSYFVLYEQIEPNDNFGKAMIANLKARGCPLLSILAFPTLADQERRFLDLNWDYVQAWSMEDVYEKVVVKNVEERRRVDSLEFLDELEEWKLFNRHYCIVIASHLQSDPSKGDKTVDTSDSKAGDWKLKFTELTVSVGPARKKHADARPSAFFT